MNFNILAENHDAGREINVIFVWNYRIGKQGPAASITFSYLGFVFLIITAVNCIIRLIYPLKICLSLGTECCCSQQWFTASPF